MIRVLCYFTGMRECPRCGDSFPETFRYCPLDGVSLVEEAGGEGSLPAGPAAAEPAMIKVRTLMAGIGLLLAALLVSFTLVFLYQYLRPKYGSLVVKTTPPGAMVFLDGRQRGPTPLTLEQIRAGGHRLQATRDGYKEYVQQVEIIPYSTENLHWTLEPLVPVLTNEQLAEIESWRKKLERAQKESIFLPPPEDYNVLYFANKMLSIDPANELASDVKERLAQSIRHSADVAYAGEDWLEAEKQYKNLALIFPDDILINERLADIGAKIDASVKDRESQIAEWSAAAEAAMKAGNLAPPEKDNALDALRNIQRLDAGSPSLREGLRRLKEMLQTRGDRGVAGGDFAAARNDFRVVLQFFPEDGYSQSRLAMVEAKLSEAAAAEQQRALRLQEEQQSRQRTAALRLSALNSYRSGAFEKAIGEWQEYLRLEPGSDEACYYLGASHLERKELDTAILYFEKCLALNPAHLQARLNLGLLYDRHRNDIARALEHLRAVKDGGGADKYPPDRLQRMIQELQERSALIAMEKIPFAVEHKHAFSSCRGSLRFSATGIEYNTEERDHSFFEPYGSLRMLSVVDDDLGVRTQNNRKYNFQFLKSGDGSRARQLASRYTLVTN